MIYPKIAMYIFLISLCSSWTNSMFAAASVTLDPSREAGLPFAPDPRWQNQMDENVGEWNVSRQGSDAVNLGYGDVLAGAALFIKGFADATITLFWFLTSLGIPSTIALTLTAAAYFAYGQAGVYLLSGRNVES